MPDVLDMENKEGQVHLTTAAGPPRSRGNTTSKPESGLSSIEISPLKKGKSSHEWRIRMAISDRPFIARDKIKACPLP
jgi:hypothetical protein